MSGTAIGLRAQKGGAVCVVVTLDAGEPRVSASTVLATGAEADRLAFEPYGVAREMVLAGHPVAEAIAAVTDGRRRQDKAAAEGLRAVMAGLGGPVTAALLVNRAGWITDLLNYSLEWAEHVPVAEGLAVREALRTGCSARGLPLVEFDEKTVVERAAGVLGLDAAAIEARLKAMGTGMKPWRKEQKLSALAAWLAVSAQ
jgi:hypothetical protein